MMLCRTVLLRHQSARETVRLETVWLFPVFSSVMTHLATAQTSSTSTSVTVAVMHFPVFLRCSARFLSNQALADPQTADADRRGTRLQKGGRKGFLSKDKETKAHNRTNNAEKEPKGPEPSVYFRDAIQALSCRFFEKHGCMPPFISNSTLLYHHKSYMESVETEREPLFQREGLSREERLYLSMMDARQN